MVDIKTLRGPKILGMAIFDWVFSLLAAYLIGSHLLTLQTPQQWVTWTVLWILFGVMAHSIFGINTQFGYYLGLNPPPLRS